MVWVIKVGEQYVSTHGLSDFQADAKRFDQAQHDAVSSAAIFGIFGGDARFVKLRTRGASVSQDTDNGASV